MNMNEKFLFSVFPVDNKTIPIIGRDNELNEIKQHILEGCNISIIGDRKIGKSSILKTLKHDFSDTKYLNKIIPIYIDFQNFAYSVTGEMLLDKILRNVYRSCDIINNEFKNCSYGKADEFSEVVEFCNTESIIILLLFDNFDLIPILKKLDNAFWTHLRGNAESKELSIVTASRSSIETLCHKGDLANSHFWNNFDPIISLSVFEENQHAKTLLSRGIANENIKDLIISLVGVHPFFLKVAANAVIENKLTNSDNGKVIENAIYEKIKPNYEDCLKLLRNDDDNIDNGVHYKLEYITTLNAISSSEITDTAEKREITNLKQLGYIQVNPKGILTISSPLFARYLKETNDKSKKTIASYIGDKPYIFISYAHADSIEVLEILQKLMDNNFRFWFDEGIEPGNKWRLRISEAIMGAHLYLVFISPNSIGSEYVSKEMSYAIDQKKQILPVYLAKTKLPGEFNLEIGPIQGLKKYKDENNFMKKLLMKIDIVCKD